MPGFVGLDDTEMPALRKHALNITQDIRAATCRRFLTGLTSLHTSIHLQVILSEQPLKLADDLGERELEFLAQAVDELQQV